MQRVRAGLTGLAAIFLMVLIAAAGMKPNRSAAPAGTHGETLAVLGVAPGPGDADRRAVAETKAPPRKPPVKRPTTI
ncbi:hypothetical protein FMM06_02795 [Glacieibacterium frigidum]|uniref:Uncharacterized protein n=2 Tax=Glacieibacterium frigidum TaxID=2593303 RepID=A0A552UFY7_9SPHN|nr:hypothetical protein FMM06_02795 [Glacieibacterium frigidum]